jgi:hypothetical protein
MGKVSPSAPLGSTFGKLPLISSRSTHLQKSRVLLIIHCLAIAKQVTCGGASDETHWFEQWMEGGGAKSKGGKEKWENSKIAFLVSSFLLINRTTASAGAGQREVVIYLFYLFFYHHRSPCRLPTVNG